LLRVDSIGKETRAKERGEWMDDATPRNAKRLRTVWVRRRLETDSTYRRAVFEA